MMSTPSSVTSPAMQAIFVVPISRPTMISEVLDLAMLTYSVPLGEGDGDVIGADVEVDGARAGSLGIVELGPRGVEDLHERRQAGVDRSEVDRDRPGVGLERERAARL